MTGIGPPATDILFRCRRLFTVGAIVAILIGLVTMVQTASASIAGSRCPSESRDPLALYGDQVRFQVMRNGAPIGHHEVRFRGGRGEVIADSRFEVEVKLLFFTAYRYEYRSQDVWRDGCMVALRAETNDNGRRSRIEAELEGGALRITSEAGSKRVEPGIFPTTHWNSDVIGANRVLNTITGMVATVDIVAMGEERVGVENRAVMAQRYRYTGEIEADVWYDAEGRWVKMRFNAEDGSTIEYVCEQCAGGTDSG